MGELQEGIYFDAHQTPGRCFTIAFLRATEGATASDVHRLLVELGQLYADLRRGVVPDLPGAPVPPSDLTVLIGFGPKAFALPGAARPTPERLGPANLFRSAAPGGGNPILVGSKLRYAAGLARNPATEDVAVQFIGSTPLSVRRPVVETWKLLHDRRDPDTGVAALSISATFSGFNREDHRSWIDFHDGVSNLESGEPRRRVLEIRGLDGEDGWTNGGSYLAFLRLAVDLARWRGLSRHEQEVLVGREKVSGCPLVDVGPEGEPVPAAGCPVAGTVGVEAPENARFREPPQAPGPLVRQSHVQRANVVKNPASADSLRVFRQGYEFLEDASGAAELTLGLNFVSFQDSPRRLVQMLSRPSWLKDVNFGGDPDGGPPGAPELLTVHAAGSYLVPPVVEGEAFPGESIFTPRS